MGVLGPKGIVGMKSVEVIKVLVNYMRRRDEDTS